MNRRVLIAVTLMSAATQAIAEDKYLDRVETEPRAVAGASVHQLAERGRLCILQHVTNDAVALKDTSRVNPMASIGTMTAGDTTAVQGGDVLQTVDLDAGLIVAQSRTAIPGAIFNRYFIQSTVTFEARAERFRLSHTGIKYAMQDTGYASNSGFTPVRIQTGSPYKKIEAALQVVSTKIADCVAAAPVADW